MLPFQRVASSLVKRCPVHRYVGQVNLNNASLSTPITNYTITSKFSTVPFETGFAEEPSYTDLHEQTQTPTPPVPRPDAIQLMFKLLYPDEEYMETEFMLNIKKMTAVNPDLLYMSETKLRARLQSLSEIVLHPSFYKAYCSRYLYFRGTHCYSDTGNIPFTPPTEWKSKTLHPLVRHIAKQYPLLLRRKNYKQAVQILEKTVVECDPYDLLGKYPPLLNLDLDNKIHDKIFYLNNIFDNPTTVFSILARQPDLLNSRAEITTPKRMDLIADLCNLSNDSVLAFVDFMPRVISNTLPSRAVLRLAVFKMLPPTLDISDDDFASLGKDEDKARDIVEFFSSHKSAVEATWRSTFFKDETLFKAMKEVLLMKDSIFNLLFSDFAAARKKANIQKQQHRSRVAAQRRETSKLNQHRDARIDEDGNLITPDEYDAQHMEINDETEKDQIAAEDARQNDEDVDLSELERKAGMGIRSYDAFERAEDEVDDNDWDMPQRVSNANPDTHDHAAYLRSRASPTQSSYERKDTLGRGMNFVPPKYYVGSSEPAERDDFRGEKELGEDVKRRLDAESSHTGYNGSFESQLNQGTVHGEESSKTSKANRRGMRYKVKNRDNFTKSWYGSEPYGSRTQN